MTQPEAAPPSDTVAALAQAVGALARAEQRGPLASLRRMDYAHPASPTFFTLLAKHARWAESPEDIRRCACFVQILALKPDALNGRRLGTVLAETFSDGIESRVQRLLAARGDGLLDQARLIARRLAGEGQLAYRDLGALLLARSETDAEAARLRIAKDYWRTLDRTQWVTAREEQDQDRSDQETAR